MGGILCGFHLHLKLVYMNLKKHLFNSLATLSQVVSVYCGCLAVGCSLYISILSFYQMNGLQIMF